MYVPLEWRQRLARLIIVEHRVGECCVVAVVVGERHEDVPWIPGHDQITQMWVVRQAVQRQVRLDEAPMGLTPQCAKSVVDGNRALIDPG
jgi:hypothetical protein